VKSSRPLVRPILYLPNLSDYRDRANLFGHVIRCAGSEGVLVTSRLDVDPTELGLEDINIIFAPPRWRFPGRSMFGASRTVGALLQDGDFNVVHDTFGHLLPLMFRKGKYPNTVFTSSLYILAEWDLRRWIWPRHHLGFLRHHNLRPLVTRTLTQRLQARLADAIVVQAPGLIDRFVEITGVDRSRVEWISNTVIAPDIPPVRPRPREGPITLLSVGGFAVGKGADKVLSLLARARDIGLDLRLKVLGGVGPPDGNHLMERVENENLQDVFTVDSRVPADRVGEWYASADWLFHVSEYDGSPRVVLEALARGLPVIGSRHPGIQVIDPDDDFIMYADPWNPDAVLDEIIRTRSDPAEYNRRANIGREFILENFSSRAVAPHYIDLYSRLLSVREGHV